jgi:hypothetical protein
MESSDWIHRKWHSASSSANQNRVSVSDHAVAEAAQSVEKDQNVVGSQGHQECKVVQRGSVKGDSISVTEAKPTGANPK